MSAERVQPDYESLIQRPGAWLAPGADTGIVISSRIRLARNLASHRFPGWAGPEECEAIWRELAPVWGNLPSLGPFFVAEMATTEPLDKRILFERHLISREEVGKGAGSGLIASLDERTAVMVNEEDHFRMQVLQPGLALREGWERMDRLDSEIGRQVAYAYSRRLGYLTSCPTNVGTGLRASVMLHMPGLVLLNEITPVMKGLTKIGLAVRGLWGEGTEALGNLFQVSNQVTLGDGEQPIIENLEHVVLEMVDIEKNARLRLMERKENMMRDHVGRAYGVLSQAYILSSREALDLLSDLRLGLDLGIVPRLNRRRVDELLVQIQPGHLQKLTGRVLKPKERDRIRAEWVRTRLVEAGRDAGAGT